MNYTREAENKFNDMRDGYVEKAMERGYGAVAAEYAEITDGQLNAARNGAVNVLTPTLDFMRLIKEESQTLGDFLEYIKRRYIMVDRFRKRSTDEMTLIAAIGAGDFFETEKVLADYYGIDLEEAERERTELLKSFVGNTHREERGNLEC